MALHTLADDPQPAPNPPVQINVEDLMGQLSDVDLLQAADAYFARLNVGSEQCRNPLSNVADAIHITRNVSLLLQAVDVFPVRMYWTLAAQPVGLTLPRPVWAAMPWGGYFLIRTSFGASVV